MAVKLKWIYSPASGWSQPSYSLMMGDVKVASAFYNAARPKDSIKCYRILFLLPGRKLRENDWPTLVDCIGISQRVTIAWLKSAGIVVNDTEVEFDHTELDKHVKQPEPKDV